jgi:hypothetical protein
MGMSFQVFNNTGQADEKRQRDKIKEKEPIFGHFSKHKGTFRPPG